jgi:hypothetical protein
MKAKYLIGAVGILFMFVVNAAEPYQLRGTITDHIISSDIVLIGYEQYQIDRDTVVHGATKRGELGSILSSGQKVGFNVEQNSGDLPRITEAWVLE